MAAKVDIFLYVNGVNMNFCAKYILKNLVKPYLKITTLPHPSSRTFFNFFCEATFL